MDLFEIATRKKFRFPTDRGDVSVEALWDMPLSAKNGFDLDHVAKQINRNLKEEAEESFVETSTNPRRAALEISLDIVKHIIGVKKAEADEAKKKADRAAERARIREILANKNDAELVALSKEDLQKRLDALGSD